MGRRKQYVEQELTFAPKISAASKRIALRLSDDLENQNQGVPRFMRTTLSKKLTLEPITSVAVSQRINRDGVLEFKDDLPESEQNFPKHLLPGTGSKSVLPSLSSYESQEHNDNGSKGPSLKGGNVNFAIIHGKIAVSEFGAGKNKGVKIVDAFNSAMSKNAYLPPKAIQLDESVFTFHPKVSSASARIAENLGTDFMERQQLHLEKQKRLLEQSNQHFRFPSQLSSIVRRQDERESELLSDLNNNANQQDLSGDIKVGDEPGRIAFSSVTMADQSQSLSVKKYHGESPPSTGGLQRLLTGPYAASASDLVLKNKKKKRQNHWLSESANSVLKDNELTWDDTGIYKENELAESLTRSKTVPSLGRSKVNRKLSTFNDGERLRLAKEMVEKAIKFRKVFTIQGGYSSIRHSLRRRGWVEKFYKIPPPPKKTPRTKRRKTSDDDDDDDGDDDDDDDYDGADTDDDDNDQPKIPPWEEDDGVYGIMSRMLRNTNPAFFWVLKRDVIDYRYLARDQMVNHYCKAGSFTTKVGLCVNMKSVPWFHESDPNTFFPRCYRLSHDEDKQAFIDDYRLTACMNILKFAAQQNSGGFRRDPEEFQEDSMPAVESEETASPNDSAETKCSNPDGTLSQPNTADPEVESPIQKRKKKRVVVPFSILETAISQCEKFLAEREHEDIDELDEVAMSDVQWDDFLSWYYQLVHEDGAIESMSWSMLDQIESMVNRIRTKFPQFDMDGIHNVWIVKPGAKSRGRGITCYDRLEEMLKLVSSQVVKKDGKYVVQKYIERPLLIYNTKFDIRQWFLVTDWNPLTLYFYQDSYLRFCSQQFTLEDFDQAIHLSNNAIQKYCKNGPRSSKLPAENMWTHYEFKDFLKSRKQGDAWEEIIYPGMKKAIICSLLCTQDLVEYRKGLGGSSFELYGADFMLTEDLHPWLIEINSSPSMEASTSVTAKLCNTVLDDTIKVAVDRKYDKNCDIGAFELAYKQSLVTVPPYIGITLSVDGQAIRKPTTLNPRRSTEPAVNTQEALFVPRPPVVLRHMDRLTESVLRKNFSAAGINNAAGPYGIGIASSSNADSDNSSPYLSKSGTDNMPALQMDGNKTGHLTTCARRVQDVNSSGSNILKAERLSELKMPSGQSFSASRVMYTHHMLVESNGNKRIVSKTSTSSSYPVPQPPGGTSRTLVVNNVESTDLKTFKPSKGRLSVLSDNAWQRTCSDCGSGMNLRLQVFNPGCRCQQDSLVVSLDCEAPVVPNVIPGLPARPTPLLRPRSSSTLLSPKPSPPRASVYSLTGDGAASTQVTYTVTPAGNQGSTPSQVNASEKTLLRYSEAVVQPPSLQNSSTVSHLTNTLPKLRRYTSFVPGSSGFSGEVRPKKRKSSRGPPSKQALRVTVLPTGTKTESSLHNAVVRSVFWDTKNSSTPISIFPQGATR